MHWLKQHEQHERPFRADIETYFDEQAKRVADRVQQFDQPGPSITGQVFDVASEHAVMMETVEPHLFRCMVTGAQNGIDQEKQHAPFVDFGFSLPEDWFEFPPEVQAAIRQAFDELIEQDYWFEVQRRTATDIARILESGVEQGANAARIARRLREEMGGKSAHKRALRIARTETTGSINAGHVAQSQRLESLGIITVKSWFATGDNDVRQTHVDADGQRVQGSGGKFIVGGEETPYPGWWGLSASERINCRCTFLSETIGDEIEQDLFDEP